METDKLHFHMLKPTCVLQRSVPSESPHKPSRKPFPYSGLPKSFGTITDTTPLEVLLEAASCGQRAPLEVVGMPKTEEEWAEVDEQAEEWMESFIGLQLEGSFSRKRPLPSISAQSSPVRARTPSPAWISPAQQRLSPSPTRGGKTSPALSPQTVAQPWPEDGPASAPTPQPPAAQHRPAQKVQVGTSNNPTPKDQTSRLGGRGKRVIMIPKTIPEGLSC
ncbi:hypothetical protein B0T14DRAFT_34463 [Immersiella caudata]|uniref:Uncharacterized protein n=1 Tax=Immersiella caudata TaxID=314043 RepID=A0AA39XEH1_9PEZI|nr:hypothetical protein B0T14DRAFT_34463 [Immersiella caudata]